MDALDELEQVTRDALAKLVIWIACGLVAVLALGFLWKD
jgi:hypothetical protein